MIKTVNVLHYQFLVELKDGRLYFKQTTTSFLISFFSNPTVSVGVSYEDPDTGVITDLPSSHPTQIYDFYLNVYDFGGIDLNDIRV